MTSASPREPLFSIDRASPGWPAFAGHDTGESASLRLQAFPGEVAAADALRDTFDRLVQRDVVDDAGLGVRKEPDTAQPGAHLQQHGIAAFPYSSFGKTYEEIDQDLSKKIAQSEDIFYNFYDEARAVESAAKKSRSSLYSYFTLRERSWRYYSGEPTLPTNMVRAS